MFGKTQKTVSMKFAFFFLLLASSLQAGVYLEKPYGFNDRAPVVACCYLHYEDKILLLHRQDRSAEGNRWGIPGGKLRDQEDVVEGIIREIFEETSLELNRDKVHYIGQFFIRVGAFDFQYCMFDYLEPISSPGSIRIDFKEHKGFTWVTPKDALQMSLITDEDTCFRVTFGL